MITINKQLVLNNLYIFYLKLGSSLAYKLNKVYKMISKINGVIWDVKINLWYVYLEYILLYPNGQLRFK